MSTWNFEQAPFGGFAWCVDGQGTLYTRPAFGLVTRYPGTVHEYVAPVDRDDDHNPAMLTFNGKGYTSSPDVELDRHGKPSTRFGYSYGDYSESARRQLSEWLEGNYARLATPAEIAAAELRSAETAEGYAAKELAEAKAKHAAARARVAKAQRALARLTR